MIYEEGILGIPKQFEYEPEVVNKDKIRPFKKIIVLGMGGSRLAGDILNMAKPELDIHIHSDYDLPLLDPEILRNSLIIANSYSGNTAETISGAKMAIEQGLNLIIITTGGELLTIVKEKQIPHIVLPHTELPPRMMLSHDLIATAELVGLDLGDFKACSGIDASALKSAGTQIAGQIGSTIPLIYTSERLNGLGYIWKIILNETAKMPAFHNRLPEADHNEIAGFQGNWEFKFHCVFLRDELDTQTDERMDLTSELFQKHKILITTVPLEGSSLIEKIIRSIIIAHWTALELATTNNIEPLSVPEIEDFKKKLQS
jgi:glucose/mannose-6-phosphate isomerase